MININTRFVLWAFLAVMATTGEASASSPAEESVRTQVDALANAGIASANKNDCVSAGKYAAKITAFLKQNQISISVFENTRTAIEQEMQNKMVTTLGAIQACNMRASVSVPGAPSIPAPVQRPSQPAPNYVTSSTPSSDSGLTTQMQAEIADITTTIRTYNGDPRHSSEPLNNMFWYNIIMKDPAARSIETKLTISRAFRARGDWGRSSVYDDPSWLHDDQKFNDMTIARRWYQRALDQTQAVYPDIRPNGLRASLMPNAPSDPSGHIRGLAEVAQDGVETTPTPAQRAEKLARIEKKDRDAVAQQKAADAYRRTPEGKKQCLANCDSAERGCEAGKSFAYATRGVSLETMLGQNCPAQRNYCVSACNN